VAKSSAFATGLTLAEAMSVGFLEPDSRAATMLKGFARHYRQGNKQVSVFSWMFLAKESAVEDRICRVNKLRSSINEAAIRKTTGKVEGKEQVVEKRKDDLYA